MLSELRQELVLDPLTRGYSAMTDDQVLTSLTTANRTRNRSVIASYLIVNALVPAEWAALSDIEKSRLSLIISAGFADVSSTNVRNAFLSAFGAGTATRTALAGLQTENITRLVELGIGTPHLGDIAAARS